MEAWASSGEYGQNFQFLCVCVDNRADVVAKTFGHMFRFQHAMNGYIPSKEYFPVGYGQLGCGGFIVVDQKGRFISRKTKAYLQYGDGAFRDVERLLNLELTMVTKEGKVLAENAAFPIPMSSFSGAPLGAPKSEATVVSTIECPPSVGIDSMDEEHQECTTAINQLLRDPSLESLKAVIQVLEDHFRHEEDVLRQHGFGGSDPDSSFSPLVSHRHDHQRILMIGRDALTSCEAC